METDRSVEYVLRRRRQRRIHSAPVEENGQLLGIVTLSDIVSAMDRGLEMDASIGEIMVRKVVTIPGDMRLYEVIRRFKEQDIGRVIVMEEDKPVGILTHSEIIRVFPTL